MSKSNSRIVQFLKDAHGRQQYDENAVVKFHDSMKDQARQHNRLLKREHHEGRALEMNSVDEDAFAQLQVDMYKHHFRKTV